MLTIFGKSCSIMRCITLSVNFGGQRSHQPTALATGYINIMLTQSCPWGSLVSDILAVLQFGIERKFLYHIYNNIFARWKSAQRV